MAKTLHGANQQGAGNTAFPLLQHNENPELVIWATDYSHTAVDVVKVCLTVLYRSRG